MWKEQRRTEFPAPNFFSVPMTAPLLCAALRADLPLTTVSRAAPPPRVLVPIFVTVSQSSMIAVGMCLTVNFDFGGYEFGNTKLFECWRKMFVGCLTGRRG
jgi:hypothetical protein